MPWWVPWCMWLMKWTCIWCAKDIFGQVGHLCNFWHLSDEIKGLLCMICIKMMGMMCMTRLWGQISSSVWWSLTRVSMSRLAYAWFDPIIVLPTCYSIPGEVFVVIGLVLVSHAMCFVCVCVCTIFIIACAVVSAFVIWAYTNVHFTVLDPYLSWLGVGVLVLAVVGVGSRSQECALALS